MVFFVLLVALNYTNHAYSESLDNSKSSLLAKRFSQEGLEFGWFGASASSARGGRSRATYRKITSVSVNNDQLELKYDWHQGILRGTLRDNIFSGDWLQDNGKGHFQLVFDRNMLTAKGWWKDDGEQQRHNAYIRTAQTELAQFQFGIANQKQQINTGQFVQSAGNTLAFNGRPLDICLSPDKKYIFVKNTDNLLILEAKTLKPLQVLPYPEGENGSMHGIAAKESMLAVSGSHKNIMLASTTKTAEGKISWHWDSEIALSQNDSNPCGIAFSQKRDAIYVCLSMKNCVAEVSLPDKKLLREIPTGICPIAIELSKDGKNAFVVNFGGRKGGPNDHTESSAGTPVLVDDRSISSSGTVSRINLNKGTSEELEVGLHPADLKLASDEGRLYVASANSDFVSIVNLQNFQVENHVSVRPNKSLPFGSIPNALSLSKDGKQLFVANAGNNAMAVIDLKDQQAKSAELKGFISTGWFPGAICNDGSNLYIANVKGEPSKLNTPQEKSWSSVSNRGSVSKIAMPKTNDLSKLSENVKNNGRFSLNKRELEAARPDQVARPMPERNGEPSQIEHVIYVIKENRTYDQLFGDIEKGNGDKSLCTYGRQITPNHHALAEEFVLLDNYYCNGVVSADGHQWATQGTVTDYQEKIFGGHVRSYDFGSDSLCYAACNFLWDSFLAKGLSVRNYGEFDFPKLVPSNSNWYQVYADAKKDQPSIKIEHAVPMKTLREHTCTEYPGWNLAIPDTVRIKSFLSELKHFEAEGNFPNLLVVYLPQDHTAGLGEEHPTPRAFVADNDLALGQLVEAVSHSKFWSKTAIFVNEDDPQDGWDHVDGHRSLCLVVSPYTRRQSVNSHFYNQLSVLHSIERIFGLAASNQLTQQAEVMSDCFSQQADLTPYTAKPNQIPLDEPNKKASACNRRERELLAECRRMNFSKPDKIDDDEFNKILWYTSKGVDSHYPAEYSGAHGKGLKTLNLKRGK